MMQELKPTFQFEWVQTEDGSPTLRLWTDTQAPECMHHSGGALSESLYIYGRAIEECFLLRPPGLFTAVLSVGLGLGYNEILATALAAKHRRVQDLKLTSFECDPFLRQSFLNWLSQGKENSPWGHIYDEILQQCAATLELAPEDVKAQMKSLWENRAWHFFEALDLRQINNSYHCIFFDAFSSGATPELWGQDFLEDFLHKAAATDCVLSTYAAKGSLKRALKKHEFLVELRPGFSGKRQSTLAVRRSAASDCIYPG